MENQPPTQPPPEPTVRKITHDDLDALVSKALCEHRHLRGLFMARKRDWVPLWTWLAVCRIKMPGWPPGGVIGWHPLVVFQPFRWAFTDGAAVIIEDIR